MRFYQPRSAAPGGGGLESHGALYQAVSLQDLQRRGKHLLADIADASTQPADWLLAQAAERTDFILDRLDLRDFDLPFFAEASSNLHVPRVDPNVLAWQDTIRPYDGYIFVVAEYNHSITGALKNALDQAYVEWVRKPFSALGYGSTGGARAVEHLRGISVELQMVPSKFGAHIGGSDLFKVHPLAGNAPISEIGRSH